MAGTIRMSPDDMRARANQYRNEAETVNGVIKKMDTLLGQLQGEWEGEASRAYAERYNELKPSFMKAEELIREIAANLEKNAQTFEQTDINLAR